MTPLEPKPRQKAEQEERWVGFELQGPRDVDGALQTNYASFPLIPAPIVSFNGPPNSAGVAPPDPNGDVGPNHVVMMSNLSFQIFNKTGTSLFGPAANNTLWAGFGGPCQTENAGDPVVLYDQLADRWLLTQFTAAGPTFFNCVAVSQTGDPTGAYFRYAFSTGTNFPDYPKYGIMPNAYFISTREFAGAPFAGVGAYAINRAQVLAGNPAPQIISFLAPPGGTPYNVGDGLLPADIDGNTLPPAGSPEYYLGSMDNGGPYGAPADALTLWKFVVDFVTPASSSFTLANTIPIAAYTTTPSFCAGRACIPQPGTANKIDHLGYRQRPLHRLAYRNRGGTESLVTNQSVEAPVGMSGIRWWEIRSPNAAPVLFQDATYSPGGVDTIHRWMGSIAMDQSGNMALAYSAANATTFPSIWYTGRLAGDPINTMPQGEGVVVNGTGSQTAGGNRWGDYSSVTVDPVDDCTFWIVNEWVPTTSASGWQLRAGSFKFPTCGGPTGTLTGTVTNCVTGLPIQNAVVTLPVPFGTATTNASGVYSAILPPGNYVVSITAPGYSTVVSPSQVVTGGGTTTFNACLQPSPVIAAGTGTVSSELCLPLNGVIDPNEDVAVSLCVTNTGTAATTNLVGTLQLSGGVATAGGPQTYGVVPTGGAPVCRTFTLKAGALACGATLTATVQFQDGATNFGNLAYPFQVGTPIPPAFQQNFDGVVAPALPAGWVADRVLPAGSTCTVGNLAWATTATGPDTAPNSAFSADPACLFDNRLVSPTFTYAAGSVLSFRHKFTLENGFDGGVLEISNNGGATWTDFVTAGGVFTANGPAVAISTSFSSPIAGRTAWSGTQATYVTVTANMPPAMVGVPVQIRFRMGSDTSVAGTGWNIDGITVGVAGFACAAGPCFTANDATITKVDTPDPVLGGRYLTYTVTVLNPGPGSLANVEMKDPLPSSARFAELRVPAGWTCTAPYPGITGTISCKIPTLGPNLASPAVFGIKVQAPPLCGRTVTISNTATLTFQGSDPNPANNSATATTLVDGGLSCFF